MSPKKRISGGGSKEIDSLYSAARDYVEANGGKLSVIGGIQIIETPYRSGVYTLGVVCTGTQPNVAKVPVEGHR